MSLPSIVSGAPLPATLRELIDARAAEHPGRTFVIAPADGGTDQTCAPAAALTYGQLREDCRAMAARFAEAGLVPGDTVSVFMGNGIQTARVLLAAMYAGLVANPVNLLCQATQTRHIVAHSDTRMVFVSPATRGPIDDALAYLRTREPAREAAVVVTDASHTALPELAVREAVLADGAIARGAEGGTHHARASTVTVADAHMHADAPALLMYTSGTTGLPKGVLLTHRNLLANARNISVEHQLGGDDVVLGPLPLYHINGLVVTLLAPLFHGGAVVLAPRFSARTFWRDAALYGCTWINVVPTIVAYLLAGDEAPAFDLSALKFCRSASAALPPEHHRAFEARFGIGVIETMGMTETAAPVFSNPYEPSRRRIGSIGLPAGVEAKVIDRDGRELGPNLTGEIVLRGEQVMRGYYKQPDETRAAFTADGWLRTGDLGHRDTDGYFYISGRAKELIIKGGENIAPREIDEALLKHPGVLEAAVVGVPDAAYGQEIVAFVVPRASGIDPLDLREHCLRELGRYKTPKEFRFVTELPRGPSGKVQRLKLLQPPH